jgi:hypothetical protein
MASDRVSQATGETVVISTSVLILDHKLRSVLALSENVNPPPGARRDLRVPGGCKVDPDCRARLVNLLRQ